MESAQEYLYKVNEKTLAEIGFAKEMRKTGKLTMGHERALMEVEIDVEPDELLDWDKPVGAQSQQIQKAVARMLGQKHPHATGQSIYSTLQNELGGADEASRAMYEAGIPGIRYLDQTSRAAGKGTRNIVVFPAAANRIAIKKINDQPLGDWIAAETKKLAAELRAQAAPLKDLNK